MANYRHNYTGAVISQATYNDLEDYDREDYSRIPDTNDLQDVVEDYIISKAIDALLDLDLGGSSSSKISEGSSGDSFGGFGGGLFGGGGAGEDW
jgi:uncharacterized membrane protein YgcG